MLDLLDDETLDERIRRWRNRAKQLRSERPRQEQAECVPFHVTLRSEKIRIVTELAAALEYIHQKGGTTRYMAPEVAGNRPYGTSSDVYSFAVVSYEIMTLEKPFDCCRDHQHEQQRRSRCDYGSSLPPPTCHAATVAMTRNRHFDLVRNQGRRPKTTGTIHPIHPDEMKPLLERSWSGIPSERGTMTEIRTKLERMEIPPDGEHEIPKTGCHSKHRSDMDKENRKTLTVKRSFPDRLGDGLMVDSIQLNNALASNDPDRLR